MNEMAVLLRLTPILLLVQRSVSALLFPQVIGEPSKIKTRRKIIQLWQYLNLKPPG